MLRPRFALRMALALGALGCGARTTLGVDEPFDASVEVSAPPDGGIDAGPMTPDTRSCEAPLPPWFGRSVQLELLFAFAGGVHLPLGDRAEVTLALVPTGREGEVLGVAQSFALRHLDAAALRLDEDHLGCAAAGCTLRVGSRGTHCDEIQLEIIDLVLEGHDVDCDGAADRVRGQATVRALVNDASGMASHWVEGRAELEAEPDGVAPSLLLESADVTNAPFRSLRVVASEPLTPETAVDLLGMDADPLRIEADPRGFWVGGERSFPTALRPMEHVYVSADGPITDFSGNDATAEARMQGWQGLTRPFPLDGFESGDGLVVQGGAARMNRVGSIAPIAGSFGLWMPPGSLPDDTTERWAFARVARLGRTLAFEARFVGRGRSVDARASYEVLVLDDTGLRSTSSITPSAPPQPTSDPVFTDATDVETFRVTLPPDLSGAPIVVFRTRTVACGQPSPAAFGLWLDDLRVD